MSLMACPECAHEMSDAAKACPSCGAPNRDVVAQAKDFKRAIGCMFLVLAVPIGLLFSWILGLVLLVIGAVMAILNAGRRS
jgi:hypothetical protein